jgi:hypothetical protein
MTNLHSHSTSDFRRAPETPAMPADGRDTTRAVTPANLDELIAAFKDAQSRIVAESEIQEEAK